MKKSVFLSGIACTILMLFGCMFKIMHWPGASIMLTISVFLFCFFFLPVALIANYKNQGTDKYKTLHIITFFVFSICVMGVLFKVMHWPGASIFLLIGLPLPFVLFLPAYLYYTKDEKRDGSMNFLGVMFGLIFLAVFSVLLALGISKQVLRNAMTRVYSNEKTVVFNEATIKNLKSDDNVKRTSDELCAYIDQLKCELLTATGNDMCIDGKMRTDKIWEMEQIDNKATPTYILSGEKNKLEDLRLKIKGYHKSLLSSGKMNSDLTELTNSLFDVDGTNNKIEIDGIQVNWEQVEFSNKQLVFVLDALSQIQSNVRLVECEYLASVN